MVGIARQLTRRAAGELPGALAVLKLRVCRVLRDAIPPTPPGPEGSNGNGPVRVQQVTRCTEFSVTSLDTISV